MDEETLTVWLDTALLMLGSFVLMAVLLLAAVHPKAEVTEAEINSPGSVIVEIRWPDGLDTDVDLWVKAPNDVPVGYSNLRGEIFNLLRDDLGNIMDPSGLNYENAFSRGEPAGEYIVNLHLYRNDAPQTSIPVDVMVSLRGDSGPTVRLMHRTVTLDRLGQEVTVFRFMLDDNGHLVGGSINAVPIPIRSGFR